VRKLKTQSQRCLNAVWGDFRGDSTNLRNYRIVESLDGNGAGERN
jgi:hypothetical protein